MDGSMDGWMDEWMDQWMDGWMNGWMDGWMDGQTDRQIDELSKAKKTRMYMYEVLVLSTLLYNAETCSLKERQKQRLTKWHVYGR